MDSDVTRPWIDRIIDEYLQSHGKDHDGEITRFAELPTLEDAIREAALCRLASGKRHSHQYRVPPAKLQALEGLLQGRRAVIVASVDFSQIFAIVDNCAKKIWKNAQLTPYDVAQRIAAYRGIYPSQIYLHRGTREGADKMGLGRGRSTLSMGDMPSEFSRLAPSQVEDVLCIYKKRLRFVG